MEFTREVNSSNTQKYKRAWQQKKAESMGIAKYNMPHGQLFDVEDIKLIRHADSDIEDEEEMDDISEYTSP